MSYTISKTDGSILVTLQDGTVNTDTGLTLIGRNAVNFGDAQNENFVKLLENFADTISPQESSGFAPIEGTLWWDTGNEKLRVYNGSTWNPVGEHFVANVAPTTAKRGDQWYDTVADQVKTYNGSSWLLVGPGYTSTQGKSGAIVESVVDTLAVTHTVINSYTNGNLVSVTSFDSTFTPASGYAGFTTIQPGINLLSNVTVNGTAENSIRVGNLYANVLARTDVNNSFAGDIAVSGNISLPDANIQVSGGTVIIQNKTYNGNISFYVNGPAGNTRPMYIDSTTNAVHVSQAPSLSTHVANKAYVDQQDLYDYFRFGVTNSAIISNIASVRADTSANLSTAITTVNSNLNVTAATINGNVANLSSITGNAISVLYSNDLSLQQQLSAIENTIANLATVVSPPLVGDATLNGNLISNVAYVNSTTEAINNNLTNIIIGLAQSAQNNLIATTSSLAPKASPTFTGTPTAPTPGSGDNSTRIATTAFVGAAVSATKFNYTVSSTGPTGGNNGDFWFQV